MRSPYRALVALLVCGLLQACCTPAVVGSAPPGSAVLWIAADMDTTVQSEPSQNLNFGGLPYLNVSRSVVSVLTNERSYVHFTLPRLPPGTQVLEAYVNLYENSRIDPGTEQIPFAWANGAWDPLASTWANQPNPPGAAGEIASIGPFRDVNQWRGHPVSIHDEVQRALSGTQANNGFVFHMNSPFASRRSFAADITRTSSTLGTAPRLLLRVANELQPFNAGTVTMPMQLPQAQDICTARGPLPLGSTTMVLIAPGAAWPPAWAVATQ